MSTSLSQAVSLLYSPCCTGGDTGLAGAHIVFIAPIKSSCGR
jgi:hypothetical protein